MTRMWKCKGCGRIMDRSREEFSKYNRQRKRQHRFRAHFMTCRKAQELVGSWVERINAP